MGRQNLDLGSGRSSEPELRNTVLAREGTEISERSKFQVSVLTDSDRSSVNPGASLRAATLRTTLPLIYPYPCLNSPSRGWPR